MILPTSKDQLFVFVCLLFEGPLSACVLDGYEAQSHHAVPCSEEIGNNHFFYLRN